MGPCSILFTDLVFHRGDVSIGLADLDDKIRSGIDGPISSLVSVTECREDGGRKEGPAEREEKHLETCLGGTPDNASATS
jgi:hypothetical protein